MKRGGEGWGVTQTPPGKGVGEVMPTYLDGKIIDGTPACDARTRQRLRSGGRTLERSDALLQPCNLSLLLFELSPLFLDLLMCDGLGRSVQGSVASTTRGYHGE